MLPAGCLDPQRAAHVNGSCQEEEVPGPRRKLGQESQMAQNQDDNAGGRRNDPGEMEEAGGVEPVLERLSLVARNGVRSPELDDRLTGARSIQPTSAEEGV